MDAFKYFLIIFHIMLLSIFSCDYRLYSPFTAPTPTLNKSPLNKSPLGPSPYPMPGDGGAIIATNIQTTSITISWAKASDYNTTQTALEYKIVRSETPTIDTVSGADAAADIIQDWTTDINNISANTLSTDTSYYFNVLVRDTDTNMAVYTMMSQKTLAGMDSCYAFYKFNDLTDSSGNGHTLWDSGVTATQNRDSVADTAFQFSGQHLEGNTLPEFDFTTELTISAWIRGTDLETTNEKVIGKFNNACDRGYVLGVGWGRLYVEVRDSMGNHTWYNDGSQTMSNNTWYHVAMTWKTGGYLRTYVDGILDKEVPATSYQIGQVTDRYFAIGTAPFGPGTFNFQGEIDDIRIYAKEMQDFEIEYLAGLPAD
jgi:hypothetical protein